MRDVDKLKEKIELSLDNRQVVSLVIGSLVVLGVVFVLGVMMGRQVAGQPGRPAPQDVLSALDRAATPDAGVPAPALTFQQELTKPVKPAALPEVKAPAKPVAQPVASKPEDGGDAARREGAPPPASHALDARLSDAFNTASGAKSASAPRAGFALQVAAAQARSDADKVMGKLTGSGYAPYLLDADVPGKGHWYRVRLGSFHSRDEAERYLKDFKRETGMSAFVTSAR